MGGEEFSLDKEQGKREAFMKWKQVTIHTTIMAEDAVSAMLSEYGIDGVQIDDNIPLSEEDIEAQFIGIMPEMEEPDGTARISFYLHEEDPDEEHMDVPAAGLTDTTDNSYIINDTIYSSGEIEELLQNIKASLKDLGEFIQIGEGRMEISESEEEDWRNEWKKYYEPILIENILILPSWLPVPDEYEKDVSEGTIKTILIDPGVAFGTGSHETTKICIPELKKYVNNGMSVLDLGTGSGILGMTAVKLGACLVTAVDIDPQCESVIAENLELNGISKDMFKVFTGNVLSDDGTREKIEETCSKYDICVANILAPVIISLAGKGNVDSLLKKDGIFISSGILDTYEDAVVAAFKENDSWRDIEVIHMGEWVSVTAKRK